MDCNLPGSSLHGILQAQILEWVATSPGDLSEPGIKPMPPALGGEFFTTKPPRKPHDIVLKPYYVFALNSIFSLLKYLEGVPQMDLVTP